MSDEPSRSPSPLRRSTRDRRQTIIEGAGTWEDSEGSEGRNTPDLDPSRDDPDFLPAIQPRRAGAARTGHRRQEAPATLQHYPPGTQGARSPPGPAAMSDNGDCTICGGHDHPTQACPNYCEIAACDNCGQMGHLTHECTHRSPPRDSQPLSEIAQRTP